MLSIVSTRFVSKYRTPTLYVGSYEGTQVRYFDRQMAFLLHPGALTRILDRRY